MKERTLQDAIVQFRKNIDDSDYANLGAKGKYLTVPYRIKFVRDFSVKECLSKLIAQN